MKYYMPFLLMLLTSFTPKERADLIVFNARIYTVSDTKAVVEAMAIREGRVLALGDKKAILSRFDAMRVIDLEGKTVFPGFIDSHCHFYKYATMTKSMADLKGTISFEEVLTIIQNFNKQYNPEWVTGRGWDQNDWTKKEFPDRTQLDKLFPKKPVMLTRVDGHAVLVNAEAIKRSGITEKNIKKPKEALYDGSGNFSGVFLESTADIFKDMVPQPDASQKRKLLLEAERDCFALGLTSVGDAGLETQAVLSLDDLQMNGDLKIRINVMLDPTEENFSRFVVQWPHIKERMSIRAVKVYADGALGSRGACLLHPYEDQPGNTGLMNTSVEKLRAICKLAYDHGYQVCTHAIGDSANRTVLKVYGEFLKTKNDLRWRIEHAQIVATEDQAMFGQFSIVPSVQATHATSDMYWAKDRLGPLRVKTAYAYKDLLKQNGWLPNGTDFPIEEINPLLTFYAAVSRQDVKGFPPAGFQPENALSREEALKSITLWAAKAAFEEKSKGSLEPGKLADFVVLDGDIMRMPIGNVPKVKVLMTFSGGDPVYTR